MVAFRFLSQPKLNLFRWCVFWDLYCAAPERREQNEHSGEAKAFHDYSAQVHPAAHPGIPPEQHPAFQSYFPVRK